MKRLLAMCLAMVMVFASEFENIQAQTCLVNTVTDCTQGSNIYCAGSQCRTWYLDPQTGQWGLTGNPKWVTELRCLSPAEVIYTNAINIPVTASANPGQVGKNGTTNLGDQVCITWSNCLCNFQGAAVGSACQKGTQSLQNIIGKEEISGSNCTGQQ